VKAQLLAVTPQRLAHTGERGQGLGPNLRIGHVWL
jgi:hypothetical protein